MRLHSLAVIGIVCLAFGLSTANEAAAALFQVQQVETSHVVQSGATVDVGLFTPVPVAGQPPPPYAAVVLHHGFTRNHTYHANNARYMAERGIVVLTVDVESWDGDNFEQRNIANMVSHMTWLAQLTADSGDPLFGMIDPARIGIAGHSMGGKIALGAAVLAQDSVLPAAALLLLDAAALSDLDFTNAALLRAMRFGTFRADPSAVCNQNGDVVNLLNALTFACQDIRVFDSDHCDIENPTDALCYLPCFVGTDDERRLTYQRLIYLFFQDMLDVPSIEEPLVDYEQTVTDWTASNILVTQQIGTFTPTPTPSFTPSPSPTPEPSETPTPTFTETPTPSCTPCCFAGCCFIVGCGGREFGDFDDSACTDINDFLFLLDYWQTVSPIGAPEIGLNDFLNLLDYWQSGPEC